MQCKLLVLVGVVSLAFGSAAFGSVKTKKIKKTAVFLKGSGSNQAKQVSIKAEQTLKFSTPEGSDPKITQFTYTNASGKFQTASVSCYNVARQMIFALIDNEVVVSERENGDHERRFFGPRATSRADMLQKVLLVKQLDEISFYERTDADVKQKRPLFKCSATTDGGVKRACGKLEIGVRPVKRKAKMLAGKAAILFAPEAYTQGMSDDNPDSMRKELKLQQLMARINGCGLRYVLKGFGYTGYDDRRLGLVDVLESAMHDDIQEMEKPGAVLSRETLQQSVVESPSS